MGCRSSNRPIVPPSTTNLYCEVKDVRKSSRPLGLISLSGRQRQSFKVSNPRQHQFSSKNSPQIPLQDTTSSESGTIRFSRAKREQMWDELFCNEVEFLEKANNNLIELSAEPKDEIQGCVDTYIERALSQGFVFGKIRIQFIRNVLSMYKIYLPKRESEDEGIKDAYPVYSWRTMPISALRVWWKAYVEEMDSRYQSFLKGNGLDHVIEKVLTEYGCQDENVRELKPIINQKISNLYETKINRVKENIYSIFDSFVSQIRGEEDQQEFLNYYMQRSFLPNMLCILTELHEFLRWHPTIVILQNRRNKYLIQNAHLGLPKQGGYQWSNDEYYGSQRLSRFAADDRTSFLSHEASFCESEVYSDTYTSVGDLSPYVNLWQPGRISGRSSMWTSTRGYPLIQDGKTTPIGNMNPVCEETSVDDLLPYKLRARAKKKILPGRSYVPITWKSTACLSSRIGSGHRNSLQLPKPHRDTHMRNILRSLSFISPQKHVLDNEGSAARSSRCVHESSPPFSEHGKPKSEDCTSPVVPSPDPKVRNQSHQRSTFQASRQSFSTSSPEKKSSSLTNNQKSENGLVLDFG